jgi:hypothetical protein
MQRCPGLVEVSLIFEADRLREQPDDHAIIGFHEDGVDHRVGANCVQEAAANVSRCGALVDCQGRLLSWR